MTRPSDAYYSDMTSRLRKLLVEVSDSIGSLQVSEVEEFIEHSEYGLALTWLAGAVIESGTATSEIFRSQVSGLADTMGINQELPEPFRTGPTDG
jgi:hypothetical protein